MTRVDLITGFLGAGKTTFIRRYAKWLSEQGKKVEIIENEFGMAGVDTALLRTEGFQTSELSGGCICCTMQVDFALMLTRLAATAEHIIVEPSGIFDLSTFFTVMNSPSVKAVCEIGTVITIVDVSTLSGLDVESLSVLSSQLYGTGLILLSKINNQTPNIITESKFFLSQLYSGLLPPILEKDWNLLTEADFQKISTSKPLLTIHETGCNIDHQRIFLSMTLFPKHLYNPDQLKEALQKSVDGSCGIVLRIKGNLKAQDGGSYQVNCVASQTDFIYNPEPSRAMLNIIGINLSREKCEALLI